MATQPSQSGAPTAESGSAADSLINEKFALGVWHVLSKWAALTLAVQNNWGGPDSSDKRDWLAGAVADLFVDRPDTDAYDVEDVLLQAMQDEFGINVEDESEVEIARRIMTLRTETNEGNFATVDEMQQKWLERKGREEVVTGVVQAKNDGDEDEDDDDSIDDEEQESDVEMGEAPELVPARKEKPAPEVDEDGFTKVVGKKKR